MHHPESKNKNSILQGVSEEMQGASPCAKAADTEVASAGLLLEGETVPFSISVEQTHAHSSMFTRKCGCSVHPRCESQRGIINFRYRACNDMK